MCSLNSRNFIPEGNGCSRKVKSSITSKKPPPVLRNMDSSFCDKVPLLKYKIECKGSSIFGEDF